MLILNCSLLIVNGIFLVYDLCMFVKDGKKTELEEEIAALPPGNEIPEAVLPVEEVDGVSGVKEFLDKHVHPSQDKDELIDIHVGNPLRRIAQILEDIKKQKAFSFTLKGSLGIMGVAVALSFFGIFGGSKALCDKGTQSLIGKVQQLAYIDEGDFPLLTQIADAYSVLIGGRPHEKPTTRLILVHEDKSTIHVQLARILDRGGPIPQWLAEILVPRSYLQPAAYGLSPMFVVTGQYDSCSRILTIKDPSAVEPYNK